MKRAAVPARHKPYCLEASPFSGPDREKLVRNRFESDSDHAPVCGPVPRAWRGPGEPRHVPSGQGRVLSLMRLASRASGSSLRQTMTVPYGQKQYPLSMPQVFDAEHAEVWSVVDQIVATDRLLAHACASADGNAALPSLTTRYTGVALTERFRRLVAGGDRVRHGAQGHQHHRGQPHHDGPELSWSCRTVRPWAEQGRSTLPIVR